MIIKPFEKLEPNVLAELRTAGFTHVTGLPTFDQNAIHDQPHHIQASTRDLGRWGTNNGMMQIVTLDGQIWLAHAGGPYREVREQIAEKLCPNGGGFQTVFVQCSNGESIHIHYIYERQDNPYSGCNACYSATPTPKQID